MEMLMRRKRIAASPPTLDPFDDDKPEQKDPQSMPNLEQLPMPWTQLPQTACLIEILHKCFLVET
jgi:hypothetical protein